MKLVLIIATLFTLLSETAFTKVNYSSAVILTINPIKTDKNINLIKTIYHKFSSKTNPDKFEITLKGKNILSGKVTFTIRNTSGKLIYKDSFDAVLLIDYGMNDDNPSIKMKELYIKKRFSAFFNEDQFEQPAIKKSDPFDKDYSENRKIWEGIKADQTSVGFTYLTGEENSRSISWSPQQQKVVVYFSCC